MKQKRERAWHPSIKSISELTKMRATVFGVNKKLADKKMFQSNVETMVFGPLGGKE